MCPLMSDPLRNKKRKSVSIKDNLQIFTSGWITLYNQLESDVAAPAFTANIFIIYCFESLLKYMYTFYLIVGL